MASLNKFKDYGELSNTQKQVNITQLEKGIRIKGTSLNGDLSLLLKLMLK